MAHRTSNSTREKPVWTLTLANVVLLLLAVFVALLSVSQSDPNRAGQLMTSLHKTFGVEGIMPLLSTTLASRAEPVEFPQKLALLNQIAPLVDSNKAEVETTEEGFLIRIELEALFVPDSLSLRPEVQPRLRTMANLLAAVDNLVYIAGYADRASAPEAENSEPRSGGRSLAMAYTLSARSGKLASRATAPPSGGGQQEASGAEGGQTYGSPSLAYASVVATFFSAAGGMESWRLKSKGLALAPMPAKMDNDKGAGLAYKRRIEIVITRETLPTVKSQQK